MFDGFAPFSFFLTEVGWFADDVLWLAVEPAGPFQERTAALVAEFPTYLPYGGIFADPVTHLTVGAYAPVDALRAAAREIAPRLTTAARVDDVVLLGRTADRPFAELHRFALGGRF